MQNELSVCSSSFQCSHWLFLNIDYSGFPFYTPTEPLIRLHILIQNCSVSLILNNFRYLRQNVNISNRFNFWSVHGIMNTSDLLQSKILMFFLFWNVKNVKVDLMVNVKMATLSAKFVLKNA